MQLLLKEKKRKEREKTERIFINKSIHRLVSIRRLVRYPAFIVILCLPSYTSVLYLYHSLPCWNFNSYLTHEFVSLFVNKMNDSRKMKNIKHLHKRLPQPPLRTFEDLIYNKVAQIERKCTSLLLDL